MLFPVPAGSRASLLLPPRVASPCPQEVVWLAPCGLLWWVCCSWLSASSPSSRMPSLESSREETKPARVTVAVRGRTREGESNVKTCLMFNEILKLKCWHSMGIKTRAPRLIVGLSLSFLLPHNIKHACMPLFLAEARWWLCPLVYKSWWEHYLCFVLSWHSTGIKTRAPGLIVGLSICSLASQYQACLYFQLRQDDS